MWKRYFPGKGAHAVEAVRYSPEEQAIAINKTQFFKPVPQTVWEFHIGGYQVLDKNPKSRKGDGMGRGYRTESSSASRSGSAVSMIIKSSLALSTASARPRGHWRE
jgi:hypothetical protein